VRAKPDGRLRVGAHVYRPIEPGVFERTGPPVFESGDVGRRIAFRLPGDGPASHLVTERGVYRRLAWYETGAVRRMVAGGACLLLMGTLVGWTVTGVVRLLKRMMLGGAGNQSVSEPRYGAGQWLARGVALLAGGLGSWLLVKPTLIRLESDEFPFLYGLPEPVLALTRAAPFFMGLSLVLAGVCLVAWRRGLWSFTARLHYSLLMLAMAWLCVDLYRRNLLFP
jgi:hypothetical protein